MIRTGRNDLCPCGSGKKYKKCCGSSGKVINLSEAALHREISNIRYQIADFIDRDKDRLIEAVENFTASRSLDPDDLVDNEELLNLVVEWFVFDYTTGNSPTVFEKYLKINSGELRETVLKELEKWKTTPLSVYELKEIFAEGAVLQDVFTREEKQLYFPDYPDVQPGDIQLCRLLPAGGKYEFLTGSLVLSPEEKQGIIDRVTEEREKLARNGLEYNSWDQFLKNHGEILLDIVVDLFWELEEEPASIDDLPWKDPVYRMEANLLVENMRGEYPAEQIDQALKLWYRYSSEERPVMRKKGTWAAAVEYEIALMFFHDDVTQRHVADKYGVSVNTVSNNSGKLYDRLFAGNGYFDVEFSSPGLEGAGRPVERQTARLMRMLEGREFQSEEELQQFIDSINRGEIPEAEMGRLPAQQLAREIIYDAWETASPTKRARMAGEALQLDPHCVDAYVILAQDEARTLEKAIGYLEKGVEIGEKSLGKEYFRENKGRFWGLIETRPYMRAKNELAQCLLAGKRHEEAVKHFMEMLELNPNDNQGIRYILSTCLLETGRYADYKNLLKAYEDDIVAHWLYNVALFKFITEGKGKKADGALRKAIKYNKHVPDYLLGTKRLPRELPDYFTLGGKDEAIAYVARNLGLWRKSKGALDWLKGI